ncbi:MAG: hypothetical protein AAFX86_07650 [Pseudomonadota bacterium]
MTSKKREQLIKALDQVGANLGVLNLVERDAMSQNLYQVTVHETDRTPVVVDPELGGDGAPRESCFTSQSTLDICGMSKTVSSGKIQWRLSSYLCGPRPTVPSYQLPHSFVATPMSAEPVIVTARQRLLDADVEFDVFSWNPDGTPAPNVQFSWRYWVNLIVPIVE